MRNWVAAKPSLIGEQLVGESPPKHGSGLRDDLGGPKAVDSSQKGVLEQTRNDDRRARRIRLFAVAGALFAVAFQHGLGHFLDEEPYAVGAAYDLCVEFRR